MTIFDTEINDFWKPWEQGNRFLEEGNSQRALKQDRKENNSKHNFSIVAAFSLALMRQALYVCILLSAWQPPHWPLNPALSPVTTSPFRTGLYEEVEATCGPFPCRVWCPFPCMWPPLTLGWTPRDNAISPVSLASHSQDRRTHTFCLEDLMAHHWVEIGEKNNI